MTHRRIRDRAEDELFGRMAPKEENEDVAQTKRTRKIVEATKRLLMENPTLTADELHDQLSKNGATLPKLGSFRPYATQARAELGIDGRRAVAHAQDPRGEDPAGDDSEAGANSPTPAPPEEGRDAREVLEEQRRDLEEAERLGARVAAVEEHLGELDRVSPTGGRPGPIVWVHPQIADARVLAGLSAAGYVPVVCENPDHIRAVEPIPVAGVDVIMRAALGAIRNHSGYQNVKEDFGKRLAEGLLAALPGED